MFKTLLIGVLCALFSAGASVMVFSLIITPAMLFIAAYGAWHVPGQDLCVAIMLSLAAVIFYGLSNALWFDQNCEV